MAHFISNLRVGFRIDTSGGTKEILSRLKDIKATLDEQSQQFASFTSTMGSQSLQSLSVTSPDGRSVSGGSVGSTQRVEPRIAWQESHIERHEFLANSEPLNIPDKHKTSSSYLLGLPAMTALIGEYPPNLFFLLESRHSLPPELSLDNWDTSMLPFHVDSSLTDPLVSAFFSTAHLCHPILDPEAFRELYRKFLENGADTSLESALCMVVFAIGAVATSQPGFRNSEGSPPGTEFMRYAVPTLMSHSMWSFSYNTVLGQALLLGSVYFAYIVRPLHSWRLAYSAATLLQFKLSK
jgi:hypothetical protein